MGSKIHAALVSSVCLLSIITNVVSSNPETEIVQDPAADGKSTGKKSMDIRSAESSPDLAIITDRYSGVKVLRPYFTDLGIIWREVATSSGEERIRIRDRGAFIDVSRVNRNNRTVPLGTSYVERPRVFRPNVNSPSMGSNRNVPYGYAFNSNVPNGYVSGGNVPSGNVPNGFVSNVNVPDARVKGEPDQTTSRGGNRNPPPPRNNQNNFGGTSPSTTGPRRISPDANLFAAIVNDFTFKLVERMNIESNFVVSPLSIFTALSMCYLGAGGTTKGQLEKILGLNDYAVHGEPLHHGISDLMSMISPLSDEYRLYVANGLFFGKNFTVEEPFKEDVRKFYNAELQNIDFSNQVSTLRTINEWVAKKTMDAIPTLIDSPLAVHTRLIMLSAIFFKGLWKTPFPKEATFDGPFLNSDGSEENVPYMKMYRGTFPIFRSEEHGHTFIKLPYVGDQVSMIIALPLERGDIPMPSVTDQILCHMRDAMQEQQLNVISVPRFRVEYLSSLRQPLEQTGLDSLFGGSVNLTGMRKRNDVSVSDILHKAVIDVNEKGTTASATTDVQLTPLTGEGENFVANHPFAFYVVHEPSGLVLFYGKLMNIGDATLEDVQSRMGYRNQQQRNRYPEGSRWVTLSERRRV